ncbi:hypothetical protein EV122DRAFT_283943 [Schizophyllum commune]
MSVPELSCMADSDLRSGSSLREALRGIENAQSLVKELRDGSARLHVTPSQVQQLVEALTVLGVASSAPDNSYDQDEDRGKLVLSGLDLMCDALDLTSASDANKALTESLWPHVVRWLTTFRPTDRSFVGLRFEGLYDADRAVVLATRVYRTLFRAESITVGRLLKDQADSMQHLFKIWLDCPLYMSALTKGDDRLMATHNLTLALLDAHNALARQKSPQIMVQSFYHQLRCVAPCTRSLYDQLVRQTQYLVRLPIAESSEEVLIAHFMLLTVIVANPKIPRAGPCSRSVIRGFIDAANCCLEHEKGFHAACTATELFDALCALDSDNRTLRRLIDAGVFDLLLRIGAKSRDGKVDKLAKRIAATFSLASFLRAFHARYRRVFPPRLPPPGPQYCRANWELVIYMYHQQYGFYRGLRQIAQWKKTLQCSRVEGPHRQTGPWGLGGVVTLNDILQLCMDVSCYIDANRASVGSRVLHLNRERLRARQRGTQIEIIADLTVTLGGDRYEVNARETKFGGLFSPTVVTGVQILLGGQKFRHLLPMTYDVKFFQ